MKKIYTIRDVPQQQAHLWEEQRIKDEVEACEERGIQHYFSRYLPKNEDILEAGCGLGAWVIFLQKKGYRIAGIDNNREVIERLKQWNPSLNVSCGDIEHLPCADKTLGAYISLGVVEHFEEGPEKPLREAFRVLTDGGVIFLTVPFNNIFRKVVAHPLRSIYLLLHRLRGGNIYFAEYRYSEDEVKQMVEKVGFQILDRGIDDFEPRTRSLALWSEFPLLRGRQPYTLNLAGRVLAGFMNSVSRKILAAGVLVIASRG